VVTRPSTHHQPNTVPMAPVAPATTAAPPTTGVPTLAPLAGETVTITGNPGLTNEWVVHVVGHGLVPGATYGASECKAYPPPAVWRGNCFLGDSVTADTTGTVSAYLMVQKVFPGPGGWLDPPGQVDCGVAPGCMVSLTREEANGVLSYVIAYLGHSGGDVGTFDLRLGGGPGSYPAP